MTKGYIAKALFKEGDMRESLRIGGVVRDELPGVDFYNPAENGDINDKNLSLPTPLDIFKVDTESIKESEIILAELDGEDPGVMYELGLAHGINIALEQIRDLMMCEMDVEGDEYTSIDTKLSKRLPYKKVYPYLSDIRQGTIKGMKELEAAQMQSLMDEYSTRADEVGEGYSKMLVEIIETMNEAYTRIPAYGLNHYVVGGTQDMGSKIYGNVGEAVQGVKEDLK